MISFYFTVVRLVFLIFIYGVFIYFYTWLHEVYVVERLVEMMDEKKMEKT